MSMLALQISLPEQLKTYVEQQVAAGEYGTPSEYIRDLVRQDQERHRARFEAKLLDAMTSRDLEIDQKALETHAFIPSLRKELQALESHKTR